MKKRVSKRYSDIFLEEKEPSVSQERSKDSQSFQGFTYLKRGDSSAYIEQFLGKEEPSSPIKHQSLAEPIQRLPPPVVHQEPKQQNSHSQHQIEQRSQVPSQSYSSMPCNPSAFHNFQKHLTVALKHAIVFKDEDKSVRDYVKVAAKLWKAFSQSKICTKKVLHFLLGDRNEHQITSEDLRQFGFAKIYDSYGAKVVTESRRFMMGEVMRQVKEQRVLESYFQHKKIKDKQKFKKYVSIFVEQLQSGYLRKRLPRQKVAELMRA